MQGAAHGRQHASSPHVRPRNHQDLLPAGKNGQCGQQDLPIAAPFTVRGPDTEVAPSLDCPVTDRATGTPGPPRTVLPCTPRSRSTAGRREGQEGLKCSLNLKKQRLQWHARLVQSPRARTSDAAIHGEAGSHGQGAGNLDPCRDDKLAIHQAQHVCWVCCLRRGRGTSHRQQSVVHENECGYMRQARAKLCNS